MFLLVVKKKTQHIGRYNNNHVNNTTMYLKQVYNFCNTCNAILVIPTKYLTTAYNSSCAGMLFDLQQGYSRCLYITCVSLTLANDDGGRHDVEVGFHPNSTLLLCAMTEITKCRRLYNRINRSLSCQTEECPPVELRAEAWLKYSHQLYITAYLYDTYNKVDMFRIFNPKSNYTTMQSIKKQIIQHMQWFLFRVQPVYNNESIDRLLTAIETQTLLDSS